MPVYEQAMDFCQTLLCDELQMHWLFRKIKKQYNYIDYKGTLKLLVRARICGQIKNDLVVILSKYLDFIEELR